MREDTGVGERDRSERKEKDRGGREKGKIKRDSGWREKDRTRDRGGREREKKR